jgi:hypothetical protein
MMYYVIMHLLCAGHTAGDGLAINYMHDTAMLLVTCGFTFPAAEREIRRQPTTESSYRSLRGYYLQLAII